VSYGLANPKIILDFDDSFDLESYFRILG